MYIYMYIIVEHSSLLLYACNVHVDLMRVVEVIQRMAVCHVARRRHLEKRTSQEKQRKTKLPKVHNVCPLQKCTVCMYCVHVLCACAFTVQANVIMGNLLAVGGVRLQYESTTCQYMRWSGGLAFFLEVMVQLILSSG